MNPFKQLLDNAATHVPVGTWAQTLPVQPMAS